MNDSELLHAWAERRDETAFAELVRRHLGLVHASARRQVGPSPLADDVAQAVFLVLARKAGSLGPGVVLSGWLFRTTRFVAARALRAEQRRSHHETAAAMHPDAESAPLPEHWKEVEPHLDAALASLSVTDRDAVLLRYFQGKPLRAVGEQLGVNEETAKKRVSRAVEKLRTWLSGRGVVLTAAGFATMLANLPASAVPAELPSHITRSVIVNSGGASVLSLASGAIRDWTIASVRRLLPWAVTALVVLFVVARVSVERRATSDSTPTIVSQAQLVSEQASVPPITAPAEPAMSPNGSAQPISSKILLSVRSSADNRPLTAQVTVQIANKRALLAGGDLQTDSNGVIEIPVTEPDVELLFVTVMAPAFVPKTLQWQRHEFVEPTLFYQCLLDPGAVVEGVVQDEAGNPVADAKIVSLGSIYSPNARESIAPDPHLTEMSSDAHGRFRGDQLPPMKDGVGQTDLYVTHPEFVRSRVTLSGPKSLATNQVVVLRRGEWITGRVEDSNQVPVPNARIEHTSNFGGTATSGPDGVFKIGPFSKGLVELAVFARGFRRTEITGRAGFDTNELVIELPFADGSHTKRQLEATRVVRLSGTVVDDESGESINTFEIHRRQSDQRGEKHDLLGQGHNGRFDWPVDMPLTNSLILGAVADGYDDVSSDWRTIESGDQHFEFRMRRAGVITGRVLDMSGKAVNGAAVGLGGDRFGFQIKTDGTLAGEGSHRTDTNGVFSLRLKPNTKRIVAAHDAGFADAPLPSTNRIAITLHPWGVVEGSVQTAGQPAPNQKVLLTTWSRDPEQNIFTMVMQPALTDSQGRFRFDHVPASTVAIGRDYSVSAGNLAVTHRQLVDVHPGTTNEITLGSSGRAIIGRFLLSQPVPGYDWRLDLQKLEEALPEILVLEAGWSPEETRRRIRAHGLRHWQMSTYIPAVRPDGSFRIDDVPAGDYVLKLRVSTPPSGYDLQQPPEIRAELGSLKLPVTVPSGDFNDPPLDLGTITIPVKTP